MWGRFDDNLPHHPKARRAGPEACWLWVCGVLHCNRFATDGLIDALDLDVLYPHAGWSPEHLKSLARRLVDAGMWEPLKGGWRVHDYAEYQREAMKDARDERRKWEADRKAKQRAAKRAANTPPGKQAPLEDCPGGTGVGLSRGTEVGHVPGTSVGQEQETSASVSQAPVPSRPVPSRSSETSLREVDATSASGGKGEEQLPLLGGEEPPKPVPKKERPRKADAPSPMPFKIGEALAALAETSQGRFAPGEARDITKTVAVPITAAIRSYPTLDEWRLVGTWLAAGGQAHRGTLGVAWASSSGLREAMALARAWNAAGRPPVDPREAAAARSSSSTVTASSPKNPRFGIQPPAPASAWEHGELAEALGFRWPPYNPLKETKDQVFQRVTGMTVEDARARLAAKRGTGT